MKNYFWEKFEEEFDPNDDVFWEAMISMLTNSTRKGLKSILRRGVLDNFRDFGPWERVVFAVLIRERIGKSGKEERWVYRKLKSCGILPFFECISFDDWKKIPLEYGTPWRNGLRKRQTFSHDVCFACLQCGTTEGYIQHCSQCESAWYCSRECIKIAGHTLDKCKNNALE